MDAPDSPKLANGEQPAPQCVPLAALADADTPSSLHTTPSIPTTPSSHNSCDSLIHPSAPHGIVTATSPAEVSTDTKRPWARALAQIPHDLMDLLLPPSCLCCQRPLDHSQSFLCAHCLPSLSLIDHACLRCGAPLPKVVPETHGCLRCQGRSWSFKRAIAVGPYHGQLQKLVIAMKKLRHEATTLYFGRLLASRLMTTGAASEIDLIIPVPSHWWRRLVRKVSTAEVLAEAVARELHITWSRQMVRRTRYTPKQGMMRASERKVNVQGAFVAKLPKRWQGARILLIDDVLTSGSTANEVSRALLHAGAQQVIVGAIARALGDQRSSFVEEQGR